MGGLGGSWPQQQRKGDGGVWLNGAVSLLLGSNASVQVSATQESQFDKRDRHRVRPRTACMYDQVNATFHGGFPPHPTPLPSE